MHSENPHRGITMHQLPVAGNIPGLIFAVGSALIFLFAIPALWYVLVAAVAVGLVIAALLQACIKNAPTKRRASRLRFDLH
jgi:Flp pilus assembly protein TadB